MNGTESNTSRTSAVAIALSFGVLCVIAFGWPAARRGATDFRSFYAGARLVGSPELYSAARVHEIQREYSDPGEVKAFTRPPFYALFLWPLGRLPYGLAHAVWQALNLASMAGFLLLWSPHALAVVVCCWFFPTWVSFAVGQDVPLILFFVSLATFLLRKEKHFSAGLVFALCATKPHLFVLLPVLILAKRLWSFGAGLLVGGAVLAGVSFAVAGTDWPARQMDLLRLNERGEASMSHMPNLYGLLHGVPHAMLWLLLATLAVAVVAWYVSRRASLREAIPLVLCGSLLVSLHAFLYDCALLLPLLLVYSERAGPGRTIALSAAIGIGTLAVTEPRISFVGQLAVLLTFLFAIGTYGCRLGAAQNAD